jgi:hypothetical protein
METILQGKDRRHGRSGFRNRTAPAPYRADRDFEDAIQLRFGTSTLAGSQAEMFKRNTPVFLSLQQYAMGDMLI